MEKFDIDKQIFITKIDDLFFRIIDKTQSSRLIVNIHSSKSSDDLLDINNPNMNKFSVYLSRSDLGCFRLCFFLPGLGQYNKGLNDYDYIQQTFVHVVLQKFIYKCIDHLKLTNNEYCNMKQLLDDDVLENLHDHIDDKNRVKKYEPFISYYNQFKCGKETTFDYTKIIDELNNFSKLLESLYECSNNQPIFEHKVDDDLDKYEIQFCKINLNLKIKDEKYIDNIVLYYCNVNINKFNSISFDKEQFFNSPIFLTKDDKITEFGTFNTYILAGNYICKIFEYKTQCNKDDKLCFKKDGEHDYKGYILIGDRYDNIFPFNIIKKNNSQSVLPVQQLEQNIQYLSLLIDNHFNKLKELHKKLI
jgi:hypothetical protein